MRFWTGHFRISVAFLGFLTLAGLIFSQGKANGVQVTLEWDYTASAAAGFVLYCGSSSGNYSQRLDIGNTNTHTMDTIVEGTTSFCAVTAYDAATVESAYSNEVSVYVPSGTPNAGGGGSVSTPTGNIVAPTGLVAAYAFNEGAGTTVADLSGNNNNGTLSGQVTWTPQGKSGSALVFYGSDGLVTIPDSASLRLTNSMTLEAWVNPSRLSSAWRDILYKGTDNYFLEASSTSGGMPGAGGTFAHVYGAAPLPANAWTHIAVTYDRTTLSLYVNGALVSSVPSTASIAASTSPLQIGGDSIYGQYFAGVIDEVRVYNRALSQAEIQSDMNTPVAH